MFEFDCELDLGSRRRQTEWVSVASEPDKPNKLNKRQRHRQREQKKKAASATGSQQHSTACVPAPITPAQAKYRKEYRDSSVVCLSTEIESGNVEYKYCLSGCISNPNRRHQLVTQMKYRLSEGGGECFYYIGVEDDGYPRGLEPKELADTMAIISSMAASLAATARLVEYVQGGFGRRAALMHIKSNAEEGMRATDLRVAVAGSMDSGKSTLVAVLTHGSDGRPMLDNCRGSARMAVFRHKHEIESGRTSSISQQVLGYDDEGRVLNYVGVAAPTPADIAAAAARVLSFIDMGGHEKYLKTTLYGMTCTLPDYVLLCVDAQCGVTPVTREHLAIAVALEIPTAVVITKTDAVDSWQLQAILQQLQQFMAPILASSQQSTAEHQPQVAQLGQQHLATAVEGAAAAADAASTIAATTSMTTAATMAAEGVCCKGAPVVLTEKQAASLAATLSELHSCTAGAAASFHQVTFPVFPVSCVSGAGLSLLHAFLSRLQPVSTQKSNRLQVEAAGAACGGLSTAYSCSSKAAAASSQLGSGAPAQAGDDSDSNDELDHQPADFCTDRMQCAHQQQQRQVLDLEAHSSLWVPEQQVVAAASAGLDGAAEHGAGSASATGRAGSHSHAAARACAAGGVVQPAGHFQVVHMYDVEGVGWVVSGIAVSGTIEVGDSLLWGPTTDGGFTPVSVSCIQRSHVPVRQVQPGQTATLALQQAGPGVNPSSSKEALLSAAAAAQAAAKAEAAREAAAACAAVPSISSGKRCVAPKHGGRRALQTKTAAPLWAASVKPAAAAASQRLAAAEGFAHTSSFDMLADELAVDLAGDMSLDDAAVGGGSSSSLGGSSEFDFEAFGAYDDDCVTNSSVSHSESFSSMQAEALLTAGNLVGTVEGPSRSASALNSSSITKHGCGTSVTAVRSSAEAGGFQRVATVPVNNGITAPKSVPSAAASLQYAGSGSTALLGCSPSSWRSKGAVLLDAAAAPKTYWEFEALLVLLGGHWPARGLLSGCWPPELQAVGTRDDQEQQQQQQQEHDKRYRRQAPTVIDVSVGQEAGASTEPAAAAAAMARAAAAGGRWPPTKQRSKRYDYAYVIHCNSIRQIARVVHMKELRVDQQQEHIDSEGPSSCSSGTATGAYSKMSNPALGHCGLSASIQAAAALLHGPLDGGSGADSGGGSSSSSGKARTQCTDRRRGVRKCSRSGPADLGTVVALRFRFLHRPEWMQVGARMIVRDRSDGHVAAAGFVTQLHDAHKQQQQ